MNSYRKNQLDAILSLAGARGQLQAVREAINDSDLRETRRKLLVSFCDEIMQKINVADDALASLFRLDDVRDTK